MLAAGPADQADPAQHRNDRPVLLLEPDARHGLAVEQLVTALHRPESPRLNALGELRVLPRIGEVDLAPRHGRQRHALPEQSLVSLLGQIGELDRPTGADAGLHLGHVRVDVRAAERPRDRDPVMAVAHEMNLPDPVERDRRHRLPTAHRGGDRLPPPARARRGGTETAVEVAHPVDGADDRVERHHLAPELALADKAELAHDLLERQDHTHVIRLAMQPARQPRQLALAACPGEIRLGIEVGQARRALDRHDSEVSRQAR